MKKIILFLLIFISFESFGQTKQIVLASDIWPPFTNMKNRKSFATDLVLEAMQRVEIKTVFEIEEFDDVLKGIQSGEFDGSAALWISDERKEYLYFSDPYLVNQLILVGRKGSDVSAGSIADLNGKRIGVVENYAYDIDASLKDQIEFIAGKNDQQNLERLLSDQIDYMLVDALLIQYLLKFQVNDVKEYLEVGETTLLTKTLHFALHKRVPEAEEIIARFNSSITSMIADGSYNRILELNWIRTDIDGDGQMELVARADMAGQYPPSNVYGLGVRSSTSPVKSTTDRYYIDGKTYNSWDKIPAHYKNEIIMGSQTVEGMGFKLDFK